MNKKSHFDSRVLNPLIVSDVASTLYSESSDERAMVIVEGMCVTTYFIYCKTNQGTG